MSRSASYTAVALSAWVLCVCWALASPVGSAPDDDYHLASIYCLSGDESLCRDLDGGQGDLVEVPAALHSSVCFAFDSEESGACTQESEPGEVFETERYNHTADYPPTFYAAMSIFAGSDVTKSVLVMRVVALSVALLVLGLSAASNPHIRDSQLLAWSLVTIPLGIFLFASNNPSGWAIAGVAAIWPPAYAMFQTDDRRRFAFAASVATLAALLATSRRDSAGMAAGILGLVIIAYARDKRQLPALVVAVIQIGVLAFVFLGFNSNQGEVKEPSASGGALWHNLLHLPALWAGAFGEEGGGLGWLDTSMPGLVWVPALAAVSALGLVGIRVLRTPRALVLSGIIFALIAYPILTLRTSDPAIGFWFQARYVLPLLCAFLGVALSPIDGVRWNLSGPQRWALTVCAAVATSIAIHVQLRRYVTGTDVETFNLNSPTEWTPSGVLSPMALWLLATVAGVILFTSLLPLFKPEARLKASAADDHVLSG